MKDRYKREPKREIDGNGKIDIVEREEKDGDRERNMEKERWRERRV